MEIVKVWELAWHVRQVSRADFARSPSTAGECGQPGLGPTREIRLIAAHAWDVAGALRAGCAAAFVARPGTVLDPLVERPDVVGSDLRAVADQILAREVPGR
jgi:hypothetical protein